MKKTTVLGIALSLVLGQHWSAAEEQSPLMEGSLMQASCNTPCVEVPTPICCLPPWAHRSGTFGELLILRARDADVTYAVPVNANVPQGDLGVLDPEYDLGFRVGLTKALDYTSSVSLSYTGYFSDQSDRVDVNAPFSLIKSLVHPNEANAGTNVLSAFGDHDIDYQLVDLDYRFVVLSNECTAANFFIGGRFGRLDQKLDVFYTGAGLTEKISTGLEFKGAGVRIGGDIEHHMRRGIYAYGRTSGSLLAGKFDADYLHSSNVDPVRVASAWEAGRMVSMLDLELGAGWQHHSGWRLSGGYLFSSWIGVVKTDEWIGAVQNNAGNYRDLSDSLTFDGFVGRLEYRF
jgi:hypothetical protein